MLAVNTSSSQTPLKPNTVVTATSRCKNSIIELHAFVCDGTLKRSYANAGSDTSLSPCQQLDLMGTSMGSERRRQRTHTYVVTVVLRGAAAVAVSGRRRRHLFATRAPSAHRCLVSVETAATEITAEPPGASLWPLKATAQQSALGRKVKKQTEVFWGGGFIQENRSSGIRQRNHLVTVWLTNRTA